MDLFGIGTAVSAAADASWKIVAIHAIEAAKLLVFLLVDVVGLIVLADKWMVMLTKFNSDDKFSLWERISIAITFLLLLPVTAILVAVAWQLLKVAL